LGFLQDHSPDRNQPRDHTNMHLTTDQRLRLKTQEVCPTQHNAKGARAVLHAWTHPNAYAWQGAITVPRMFRVITASASESRRGIDDAALMTRLGDRPLILYPCCIRTDGTSRGWGKAGRPGNSCEHAAHACPVGFHFRDVARSSASQLSRRHLQVHLAAAPSECR